MEVIINFLKTTFLNEFQTSMSGDRIASGLLVSFFVTLFVLFIYRVTYQGVSLSRNYCFSLILLSMVTSVVIMTITTNLALSLGMVGALSIVRFRTAVKETSDTVFMFWAISVGIMAGAGLVYIAIITNVGIGILYLLAYLIGKKAGSSPYLLVVRYEKEKAEGVEDALKNLISLSVKSKTVGKDAVELCLRIKLNKKTFSIVDSIGALDGVLNVSAVSYQSEQTL